MKHVWALSLLMGVGLVCLLVPQRVFAQACKDETSMVDGSKQALTEFIDTVKKESVADFETMDHQKSAVIKLSLHEGMLGELANCLDKASQDAGTSKEDQAAAKAKHDATVKLQEKLKQQEGAIKDAKESKDAKALVEKVDLAP
jgi:hypothetical protein